MALYLVQHGKSLTKEIDPEKGLSEDGAAEARRIAEVAAGYGCAVGTIFHSGKKRALQTAEIMAAALKPGADVVAIEGIRPLDDVVAFSKTLPAEDNAMLVGHLPFLERLTSYLIIGSAEPPVFKLQNGGILCLDNDPDTHRWVIKWALMPTIA